MPLLSSPVYSSICLLQLQSFFYLKFVWGGSPPPLSSEACHTLAAVGHLPLSKLTGGVDTTPAFSGWLVYLQFIWRSTLPCHSGIALHMTATVTSFPLSKVAGRVLPLLPSLSGLFIYSSCEWVPLPHSLELRAPHPLCYVSSFFFFRCLFIIQIVSFSFFPGWGSVCPGGYDDLSQGFMW
jgi:hypothetical protein